MVVSIAREIPAREPAIGYRVWIRAGDRVAILELIGIPKITLSVAQQIAEAQLACFDDGTCLEPIPVSELRQAEAGATEEGTPEGEETPEA